MVVGAAGDDVAALPGHLQHFGRGPRGGGVGIGSEIADPAMDFEPAVGAHHDDAVLAAAAGVVIALADAETGHLAAVAPAPTRLTAFPIEVVGGLAQRFRHVGAGERRSPRSADIAGSGRVDHADVEPGHAERVGGRVHDRRDDRRDLVLARAALGAAVRGVGGDRGAAETHRLGLIQDADAVRRRERVRAAALAAIVGHDEQVAGGHDAVRTEADLDPTLEALAGAADGELFLAGDAHHHRAVQLLRELGGNRHARNARRPGALAEAAAGGRVDEDEVFLRHADDARHVVRQRGQALGGAMQVELAVFPIGHGAARLHGMVGIAGGGEAAFVDEAVFGGGESGFEVADGEGGNRTIDGRIFRRSVAGAETRDLIDGPFRFRESLAAVVVAADKRVGPAFLQAVERVEHEGQSLECHIERGDGAFGGLLIDRGQSQNRLADQGRFVGQNLQAGGLGFAVGINIAGSEYAQHAIHRQRLRVIDVQHPRVGNGTGEQAGVDHAFAGVVFRVFDPAGDFADHVGRDEVFSDMHIGHDDYPISAARMTPSR